MCKFFKTIAEKIGWNVAKNQENLTVEESMIGDRSYFIDWTVGKAEKIIYFFYNSGSSSDDSEDNTLYVPQPKKRLPEDEPDPIRPRVWGRHPDRIKRFSVDTEDKEGWLWIRK